MNLQKNKAIKRIKPDSFEDVGEILRPIFVQFHRNTERLEFLDLPEPYKEYDLKKAILKNMKNFLLEFGDVYKRQILLWWLQVHFNLQ